MKADDIKRHLIENKEYVEEILDMFFTGVKYYESSNQWRFAFYEDDNPNSTRLNAETLTYKNYKYGEKGDIISLLMKKTNYTFKEVLNILANKSYFDSSKVKKKVLPFEAYYKKLEHNSDTLDLNYYDESELDKYPKIVSELFLKDGIDYKTQIKFDIRYYEEQHRVIIPCYFKGSLIGAIGRYNALDVGDKPKYLPVLKYPKSKYLFGYDENYNNLINNTIIVVESEKTVLRAYSLGYKNLVALGGNNISEAQKELLYSLNPKEIILVLDKGLDNELCEELGVGLDYPIIKRAKTLLSNNPIIKPTISYINLNNFEEIPDKDNIFDLDEVDLEYYLKFRKEVV